jgi:hypothetical protein
MLVVAIDLVWPRPRGRRRFCWLEYRPSPAERKVPFSFRSVSVSEDTFRLAAAEGTPFENYRPLEEEAGLFRTFADLHDGDAARFLNFANRYGALGPGCELLEVWRAHAERMRTLVNVWDALEAGDLEGLRSALEPAEGIEIARVVPDGWDDLVEAAFRYFVAVAGEALLLQPGLLHGEWDALKRRPRLALRPPTLIRGLYLQFALAAFGGKQYRQCPACGRWFPLSPGVGRADKSTCTTSCRVKLYKGRRRRALELHAAGRKPKQIAKEIGSDVETVRTWIQKGDKP